MNVTCETQTTLSSKALSVQDNAVSMLLAKLDEGTQTIANLRSILTLKTAELSELVAQLEMTHQAITNVEMTTTQIETMLKEFGLSNDPSRTTMLINAEASLDSAIKSAINIYPQQQHKRASLRRPSSAGSSGTDGDNKRSVNILFASKIRYKPDPKHILRKLNDLLRDLELDSGKFFSSIGTTEDFEILQKAYVDLDIAKTISLSAKSNMKRRKILLRSARRRNKLEEIEMLGDKIKEGVSLWMTYTRNSPLLIDGQDILSVLDQEDDLIARNLPVHASRISFDGYGKSNASITPSTSTQTRMRRSLSIHSNDSTPHSNHSRVNSASFESFIPSPTLTPQTTNKKQNRQSIKLTPVKANVGLPRVRTTSLTQQQAKTSVTAQTTPNKSYYSKHDTSNHAKQKDQSFIPAPTAITNDTCKKSLLKPPTQLGPGSTLRIRNMLAKRNPSTKSDAE
ncbi:hypothetical protein K501DRAFT_192631 [Backusella circina FSU 941]|nr:hypothetical protein K501DRAFT_192631 [Backusella circina FSU 941]